MSILNIRRWFLSKFMSYGRDEPNGLHKLKVNWAYGQVWGCYHPDKPYQWWHQGFSDDAVNGSIIQYRYEPKAINIAGDKVIMPWRMAIKRSVNSYTKGFFKFTVEREGIDGKADSIWLTGLNTWPPEVDIVEWYNDYATTNFHVDKVRHNVGSKCHKCAKVYSCWLTDDFIRIYYDGFLVRQYKHMEWFNEPMVIIMNTSCSIPKAHEFSVIPEVYI